MSKSKKIRIKNFRGCHIRVPKDIPEKDYILPNGEMRDARFVVESRNESGLYNIVVPSEEFPLSEPFMKVFTASNCKEVTDKAVLDCFDAIEYRYGRCYSMADELKAELEKHNIKCSIWSGWLFCSPDYPMHHCWVTVGDKDEFLLDPQNVDFIKAITEKGITNIETEDECRELLAQCMADRIMGNLSNSSVCEVGRPIEYGIYVGNKVGSGEEARRFYSNLIKRMPNHPNNINLDDAGRNKTQIMADEIVKASKEKGKANEGPEME